MSTDKKTEAPMILDAKTEEKKAPAYNPFRQFQENPTAETLKKIEEKADEKNAVALNFLFLAHRDGVKVKDKELVAADGKKAGEYARKGAEAGSVLCQVELAKALIGDLDGKDEKETANKISTIDKLLTAAKANGAKIASFYQGLKLSKLGEVEDAEKFYTEAVNEGILEASYALAEIKLSRARRSLSTTRNEVDTALALMRSYFSGSQKALTGQK